MINEDFSSRIIRLYGGNVVNVTFQITDDCCCACTYCYQINKGHKYMSNETGEKIIDLLFDMYDKNKPPITRDTKGIILDFIGGEPLMNIPVMEHIIKYFIFKSIEKGNGWELYSRASFISNGALYNKPETQKFIKNYGFYLSADITLDGPREVHDKCRIYHDGKGNFDDAFAAWKDINKFNPHKSTKVTISPENLDKLDTIADFFIQNGINYLPANPINEVKWTTEQANIYYNKLKIIADKIIDTEIESTLFDEDHGHPLDPQDLECYCGGSGKMLAFNPDGVAYPCLRYMESSLGNSQPPIIIGDINEGIYNTEETNKIYKFLTNINRRTKTTNKCFYCPIASGCADCAAWNYQESGTVDFKSLNICLMHKARILANVYYWNTKYIKEKAHKVYKLYLPYKECIEIISEDEYNKLINLIKEARNDI